MSRDDLTLDLFRSAGRMMQRGIGVRVPELPRTPSSRARLQREARRDPAVRRAYTAAAAQAIRTERTRQLEPQTLIRNCGTILEIR
jgi:hypothetical protein